MKKLTGGWNETTNEGHSFVCGHCNCSVTPIKAYKHYEKNQYGNLIYSSRYIYICVNCKRPTYIDFIDSIQQPGLSYGVEVKKLPTDVEKLYDEARNCYSINAYTSAILQCRKIIMHIGVEQGGKENQSFQFYVDFLYDNHIIPKQSKKWVDKIRIKGNELNHKIEIGSKEEAEDILYFTELLLKNVYEYAINEEESTE